MTPELIAVKGVIAMQSPELQVAVSEKAHKLREMLHIREDAVPGNVTQEEASSLLALALVTTELEARA